MEGGLVRGQDDHIIGIPEIIPDAQFLFEEMIQAGEIEISQVLAEVIPDRQAGSTVDDFFQEPEQGFVLELPTEEIL